jgi:hypothetical protein
LCIDFERKYAGNLLQGREVMSSFWEFYFGPMCVVMLCAAKVGPPACDIGDSETKASELLYVCPGGVPYA